MREHPNRQEVINTNVGWSLVGVAAVAIAGSAVIIHSCEDTPQTEDPQETTVVSNG